MKKKPLDCPCHSGLRYAACCSPLHAGSREAESPSALMRSRYSAFALGLGPYLLRTLAPEHPDRARPEAEAILALSRAREGLRYLDLCILHASSEGDSGDVLFFAKIFERGTDRSFAELSSFRLASGAWRYVEGAHLPRRALPGDVKTLTRESFAGLAKLAGEPPRVEGY